MHTWMNEKKNKLVDFEEGKKKCINYVKNNSKILDIGCGDGRFFDLLLKNKKNLKLYGYDINPLSKKIILKKGYNFLNKFDKNRNFDIISIFEVIEHLYYSDFIKIMKYIDNVLKKKGLLFLSTPNPNNIENINHFWDNVQHVRPFNKESLIKFFGNRYKLIHPSYFCPIINPIKIIRNYLFGFKPFMNQLFIFEKIK